MSTVDKLKSLVLGRRPTLSGGVLRLSAAAAAISVALSVGSAGVAKPGAAPAQPSASRFVWLDQNWTADERADYHHASQGTLTLPFDADWILAVEQPGGSGALFSDPAYLETFGFIPSPRGASNPNGLPVGFARTTTTDPRRARPVDRFGFTCAACHTGRVDYQGTALLIDGGPAMIDVNTFGTQLAIAFVETLKRDRFARFSDRVLGPGASKSRQASLYGDILKALATQGIDQIRNKITSVLASRPKDVAEGPGRLDALNRIGNTVFGDMSHRNNASLTAPVAYPHIWDTHWFSWVQYNGSIEQPMVRNAGEAMGVSAGVNYKNRPTPRFTSTIPFRSLDARIERRLRGAVQPQQDRRFTGLTSPAWPEPVLGRIDRRLAAEGARLYVENCQSCHLPAPNTEAFWTGDHWLQPNAAGERLLDLRMVNIERDPANPSAPWVGTDPAQARDMATRQVRAPLALGIAERYRVGRDGRFGIYGYGNALGQVVEMTVNRGYDAENVPQSQRAAMNGNRPNGIRAPMQYKARPLNGIWATAPFLHNGSIRTLWHLLSPYREREDSFSLGSRQFDPVRVGYTNQGTFLLRTVVTKNGQRRPVAGNLNTGHLFDTPDALNGGRGIIGRPLSERERSALVEYLKTL